MPATETSSLVGQPWSSKRSQRSHINKQHRRGRICSGCGGRWEEDRKSRIFRNAYKFAKKTIIEGGLVHAGPLSERRRQREQASWCVRAVNKSGLPRQEGRREMKPERVEPLFRAEEFGSGTGHREPGSGLTI